MAIWIDENCDRDPIAWEKSTALFASWKLWADKSGEDAGTLKNFLQNVETRGYTPQRLKKGRGVRGLRLRPQQDYFDAFWNR